MAERNNVEQRICERRSHSFRVNVSWSLLFDVLIGAGENLLFLFYFFIICIVTHKQRSFIKLSTNTVFAQFDRVDSIGAIGQIDSGITTDVMWIHFVYISIRFMLRCLPHFWTWFACNMENLDEQLLSKHYSYDSEKDVFVVGKCEFFICFYNLQKFAHLSVNFFQIFHLCRFQLQIFILMLNLSKTLTALYFDRIFSFFHQLYSNSLYF